MEAGGNDAATCIKIPAGLTVKLIAGKNLEGDTAVLAGPVQYDFSKDEGL